MLHWRAGHYTSQSKKIFEENDQLGYVHSLNLKGALNVSQSYPKGRVREKSEFFKHSLERCSCFDNKRSKPSSIISPEHFHFWKCAKQ